MDLYKFLLDGNKQWVREKLEQDSQYFENLAKGQRPQFLWIGCSDSRVPANEIKRTKPGDIFLATTPRAKEPRLGMPTQYRVNQRLRCFV